MLINGHSVILRPLEREDIQMVRHWRNSPEIAQHYAERRHITSAQQQQWFETISSSDAYFVRLICDTQLTPVGVIHLKDIDHLHRRAECGLYIASVQHRSNLYAMEARFLIVHHGFQQINLHKVYAHHLKKNNIASRLSKSFGFRTEATLEEELFFDGTYHDLVRTAAFKEDFYGSPGTKFFINRAPRVLQ